MIQSKVDTRFLGTIQDSFHVLPNLPEPVRLFFMFLGGGLVFLIINHFLKKFGFYELIAASFWETIDPILNALKLKHEKTETEETKSRSDKNSVVAVSSDREILEKLVMNRAELDISGERAGQRTLAAVVNVAGIEDMDVVVTFKEIVTESLLTEGASVKCIFAEMKKDSKKVNAFVGQVKNITDKRGAVITRKSSFGYIKRRVFARRKVADQRFIKIKIWRLEDADYNTEFILDNIEPDITIDNRENISAKIKQPQVIDISKGGIALYGTVRQGGNTIARNDNILLCMLIYMPKRKVFQPHLIYAEARSATAAPNGMTRLSFQFMESLQIPPRKRSTLFKGQATMAMNLAQDGNKK